MYKENDNLNKEEIDKFRSMSQTERDKLLAEKEKEVLKEKKNQKALCRNAGCFFDFEILNFKFRVTAEFVTSYLDIVFFAVTICAVKRPSEPLMVFAQAPGCAGGRFF